MFGLRRRHAAKILDTLQHTNPKKLAKNARSLPAYLCRKEGLSNLQAESATYLAMRLGYIPHIPLSSDTYEVLGRYVSSRMNGSGLTKPITNEFMALSATMQKAGKLPPSPMTRVPNTSNRIKKIVAAEKALPHHKVLTGVTE